MTARLRVDWTPGSDVLRGTCFCGAVSSAQDPRTLLDWLDAHPVGHEPGPDLHEVLPAGSQLARAGRG